MFLDMAVMWRETVSRTVYGGHAQAELSFSLDKDGRGSRMLINSGETRLSHCSAHALARRTAGLRRVLPPVLPWQPIKALARGGDKSKKKLFYVLFL